MQVGDETPFGRTEWETTQRVDELGACYRAFDWRLSPRQLRLAFCGLARSHFRPHARGCWVLDAILGKA